jgi:hypothetical protein
MLFLEAYGQFGNPEIPEIISGQFGNVFLYCKYL